MDVDIEEGDLDDHHDSQMISQLISEPEDDDIEHNASMWPSSFLGLKFNNTYL